MINGGFVINLEAISENEFSKNAKNFVEQERIKDTEHTIFILCKQTRHDI